MRRGTGAIATLRDGLVAGAVAAVLSGLPSTAIALCRGDNPAEASLAAGSILLPRERRPLWLGAAAIPVHIGFSLGWGVVLAAVLPRRRTLAWGAAAGLAIAALDLAVGRSRRPMIRALPVLPQVADHVAYGLVVGAVVAHCRPAR